MLEIQDINVILKWKIFFFQFRGECLYLAATETTLSKGTLLVL